MKRLASALLAATFIAASAGMALAATAPAAIPPAGAAGTAAPAQNPHGAHARAITATKRLQSNAPAEARMTHALNLLEAKGYGDFRDFKQDGKNFAATVTQNGQSFDVVIDPDNNQVARQS